MKGNLDGAGVECGALRLRAGVVTTDPGCGGAEVSAWPSLLKEGLLRGNKSAGRGPATFLAKGVLERLVGRTAAKFMCGGQGLRTQRGVAWGFWNSQDL